MIFFLEENNIKSLCDELDEWIGVKYKHMGNNKNGIDCTKLVGNVFQNLKLLDKYTQEKYYPRDWYHHCGEEKIISSLLENSKNLKKGLNFKIYKKEEIKELYSGDLLIFKVFRKASCNHVAFYISNKKHSDKMFHVDRLKGCEYIQYSYLWKERTKYIGRLET